MSTSLEQKRFASYREKGGIKRCIDDLFGENLRLSNQQEEACHELSKLIEAKIKLSQGLPMIDEEILYSKKIGVSIMSGMGSGKDFFSSIIILVFLTIFKDALCTCTANSAKQLKNVLWAEISRIMALSKLVDPSKPHHPKENPTILEHMYEWQSERINFRPKEGKSHFAEAVTISPHASTDEQAKTLTGRHSKYMLMVIDEAAGVPEPVFENLEGTLTGTVNLILMIFNPIRSKGYAVKSQQTEKEKWVSLRWDCEETRFPDENMTRTIRARNEMMAEKYGKDSNPYRIKVKGLPPIDDNNSFIPWDWIQDAVNREIEPDSLDAKIMGVDPAAGGDNSVIVMRHGGKMDKVIRRFNMPDTMQFTGKVVQAIYDETPDVTVIDPIGIGKGVYDRLKEQGHKVMSGDVRRTATKPERFEKMRDEIAWKVRDQFEKGLISIPDDQDLIDQIGALKAKPSDSTGKLKLMSKTEMRREIGYSPDDWDALCLTYFYNDASFRKAQPSKDKYRQELFTERDMEDSWMVA